MTALIALCNRALAALKKGQIASLKEPSIEARECNREAYPLLNEMAEWSERVPLGRKRVVLAEIANDRPAEWLRSYAAPSDMATPITMRRAMPDANWLPAGGPFNFPWQEADDIAFLHEGGTIYCNIETPTLIYTKDQIEASDLSSLMQKAFVDALAARIATPLTGDPKISQALDGVAERSRARAIAAEENKTPNEEVRYISEAEYARWGIGV